MKKHPDPDLGPDPGLDPGQDRGAGPVLDQGLEVVAGLLRLLILEIHFM